MKRYDLMQDINTRGTFLVSKACIPHLRERREPAHPHAVAADQPGAPVARPAHRLHDRQVRDEPVRARASPRSSATAGIASNALWPRTLIATAAVQNLLGGDAAMARARKPEIYADAAYAIVTRPSRECTGNTYLCEDVLVEEGVTDFSPVHVREGRRAAGRPVRRLCRPAVPMIRCEISLSGASSG